MVRPGALIACIRDLDVILAERRWRWRISWRGCLVFLRNVRVGRLAALTMSIRVLFPVGVKCSRGRHVGLFCLVRDALWLPPGLLADLGVATREWGWCWMVRTGYRHLVRCNDARNL